MIHRVLLILSVFLVIFPLTLEGALGDPWPSQDITLIVATNPGGGFDLTARATAPVIRNNLPRRVSVVVKNIPAAAGKVGFRELMKSKPDGHTVGVFDPEDVTIIHITSPIEGVDAGKITWLGRLNMVPDLLVIGTKTGFKSVNDMKGKTIRFAAHRVSEIIRCQIIARGIGANIQFVNYGGTAEACLAIQRGDCDAIAFNYASLMRQVRASNGLLVPVFVNAPERVPGLDVPTFRELGLRMEGISSASSKVLAAPPDLPDELRRAWEETLSKVYKDPEWAAQMNKAGMPPTPLIGKDLHEWIREAVGNLLKKTEEIKRISEMK